MRILIASDAWLPQVNGVVRTLGTTVQHLERLGHQVKVIEPGMFMHFPCVVYPEIQLAVPEERPLLRMMRDFGPDAIHIATEGPIGMQVRRVCLNRRWRFTTSYATKFPEYLRALLGLPVALGYWFMKWFHGSSSGVMVATKTLEDELRGHGFANRIVRWSRAVDTDLFHPRARTLPECERPVQMYVGRVSLEKNLEAFLQLKAKGTKYVVGDGPARIELQRKYPEAIFLGPLSGEALAQAYANADVFVFPSRTDTFGLVMLEALASGVPVAAYPVMGPIDVVRPPLTGALHEDLGIAIEQALRHGDADACRHLAASYSWNECTRQFLSNLVLTRGTVPAPSPTYFANMPTLRA